MELRNIFCLILSSVALHLSFAEDKSLLSSSNGRQTSIDGLGEPEALIPDIKSADKRQWSKFATWGKRRWNKFGSWGKRLQPASPWGKKWAAFGTWGKRSQEEPAGVLQEDQKRAWNQFITWGKRNWNALTTWGKRGKWNKFATWGKRSDDNVRYALIKLFDENHDGGLDRKETNNLLAWLSTLDNKLQ